ncbi:hypothetical protein [Herbidospora cretacea]|uniref:hypothetical protein n=1 Tax=Herbidospora cretacea TaxID=28444 RepID=UPI000774A0D1|nr:hypothetical protein [Herbidospora cretacea]
MLDLSFAGSTLAPEPPVTQTDLMLPTITTPIISVAPPDDGSIDVWREIIWTDFGGAFLGVVVAIGVAVWIARRDHRARLEDRRLAIATRLLDAVSEVIRLLPTRDDGEIRSALGALTTVTTRIQGQYGTSRIHSRFTTWLGQEVTRFRTDWLTTNLRDLAANLDGGVAEPTRTSIGDTNDQIAELTTIQDTTTAWMVDPKGWKVDESYQEIWRRQRSLLFGPTPAEAVSPGAPSPRPSE